MITITITMVVTTTRFFDLFLLIEKTVIDGIKGVAKPNIMHVNLGFISICDMF